MPRKNANKKRAHKKNERNLAKRKAKKKTAQAQSVEKKRQQKNAVIKQQTIYREKREAEEAGKKEIVDNIMPSKPTRGNANAAKMFSQHMNLDPHKEEPNVSTDQESGVGEGAQS